MHQGNWKCSSCGGAITELPFVPRSENGLTCRFCYAKQKGGSSAPKTTPTEEVPDVPFGDEPATDEKPRTEGNWQCASCGVLITSLPFNPRDTSNLKCLGCFKISKG
jgi:CxxC-x17-CxxC domain-containing protein